MSSSSVTYLIVANEQLIIYVGIFIFIAGILGGFFNAIVFLSLKTFRQSSCAFYLTVLSIVNLGVLITGLLTRIMISGFAIDWTQIWLFYCKLRNFGFQVSAFVSFTCISLATIDQYLATCSRPHWRKWSDIKLARRLLVVVALIALLQQSPCLIYYNQIVSSTTGTVTCTITNAVFAQFNTYFNELFLGNVLPFSVTLVFGLLAYHNVERLTYRTVPLVRRQLDKQLTVMVLVQVVFNIFAIFPSMIVTLIISNAKITDPVILAQMNLVYGVTLCIYYLNFASPFYIYVCVSDRFRRQLIYVIFNIHLNRWRRRKIVPEQAAPQP